MGQLLEEQQNKDMREKRKKEKALKLIMEEEERKKNFEYIRLKEWEENFDKEQKILTYAAIFLLQRKIIFHLVREKARSHASNGR